MGMEGCCGTGMKCSCPHHAITPIIKACAIILFGASFLLANVGWITAAMAGILWPLAVIAIGVLKLGNATCGCCKGHGKEAPQA